MNNNLRIAIDGGAATGKSTVSRLVAEKLSINYINTGQMYRLFTLFAIRNNLLDNETELLNELNKLEFSYVDGLIRTSGFEFESNDLETTTVTSQVSMVSAMKELRSFATELQIKLGKEKGVLLEGRDIGTVIMKDADFKFYLVVDPKVAAERRVKHFASLGEDVDFDKVLQSIIDRNEYDSNREVAPLVPTSTSIIIDTSNHTAEEVANKIVEVINNG